ncbi:cytochrome P450 [Streptomyces sp. CA-210063]|uniref:cytochrome P450 n=1 Tax=Streptomyces sp. CA-210063 TaxID=2801029 RepID=UPI00214C9936|nr:cytochrome P450 [Streptomyces sp. CA-210063]UUU36201.1 cytochrome P450 [Streptomyces sp. CA-210063]
MPLDIETPLPYQRDHRCPFDPGPALRDAQRTAPVHRYRLPDGQDIWVVTRYEEVRRMLTDPRLSSARTPLTLMLPGVDDTGVRVSPGSFVNMDPPEHTRLRRTVTSSFTARRMRELAPRLERIAEDRLDAMERTGPPADFMTEFASPFPLLAICELLGLTEEQRAEYLRITAMAPGLAATPEEAQELLTAAGRLMSDAVAAQREAPGDGMIGMLVKEHGHELDDEEIAGISSMFLTAGFDTVANTLGLGLLALFDNPGQLALLRDEPAVLDTAVEELMRYLSVISATGGRTATEDVELGGVTIKAGEYVVPALAVANRDPAHFDDPDRLDLTRTPAQQVGFGHGVHRCIGGAMTLLEMRIAFSAVLRRFPGIRLAVPPEDVRYRGYDMVHGALAIPVTW